MRLTRQAALAIALTCGVLAAAGVGLWMSQQKKAAPAAPDTVPIPVPIRTIPAQTELRPAMFQNLAVDKTKVPSDVVTSAQAFQGRVSVVELAAGQPVKVGDVDLKTRMGLAFGVPRGYRGLAVSLNVVGMVGEFVKPGNRVDVLAAFERRDQVVVRTIVQDVMVLAVGNMTEIPAPAQEQTKEGEAKPAANARAEMPVTLALTPSQAQVVLASDLAGKLRLALRSTGDHTLNVLPPANSWSLVGKIPKEDATAGGEAPTQPTAAPAVAAPAVAPPPVQYAPAGPANWGAAPATPARPQRPGVEVIRGGQREIVTP